MPTNPLSIPGGWSSKEAPASEQANTKDTQDEQVPRSAASGVVSEAGDIVDDAGNTIGSVADSKNPKELAGNTVNAGGDIVNSAGDVLGKAEGAVEGAADAGSGDEYTTKAGEAGEEATEEAQKKSSGGWFNGAKGLYSTGKTLYNGVGSLAGGNKSQEVNGAADSASEQAQNATGDATENVEDAKNDTTDKAEGAQDEAQNATEDAQADDAADKVKETAEDAQETAEDAKNDTQETAEDTKEGAEEAAEGAKEDAPDADAPVQLEDREGENAEGEKPEGENAEGEEAAEEEKVDYSVLEGSSVNKVGNLVDKDGNIVGRLTEGDAKQLQGKKPDENGDIWNDSGKVIGKAEPIPDSEREENAKDFAPFENFPNAIVEADGTVTSDGQRVGTVTEGDPKRLKGSKVDEDGDILDRNGNTIGKAEAWDEPEAVEEEKVDYSVLEGTTVNKVGSLVDKDGNVVGRLTEGDAKQLQGKKADGNGDIWNDSGKVVGKAEPIPDSERDSAKDFAPFENFPNAIVEADGTVTSDGQRVGTVTEGDPKRLKGSKVDEDGDILDRNGNTVGKAEVWDEPEAVEEETPDRSILAGKRVNKAGNVVDKSGAIFGKVVEGNVSSMVGRMCDKEGNVRSESGDILGKAEVVPEGEREGSKEGPFAELEGLTVTKEGKVITPSGDVVGRLTQGDGKTLFGRHVDEDGDVLDKNGNTLGKAERWEEPEEEKEKGPMAGRKVNKEGNVVDEDGNIIGKLVNGDVMTCAGKEIDDDGDVINSKGNTVGHVALLEDIPPEEETEEQKKEREQAEKDRELAKQMAGAIEQSLEKIRPILKMITDKIDSAEKTPKEDLDEEQLVKEVKPLIEEGNKVLTETNGMIRGMDPDGRIQRNAKHKSSTKDASPEEHHLAEMLKELTGGVTETVENAKRKIEGMPHAKKELNPLWGLLMEPLGQILAAVGLLLNGVLGLVGRLLSGLGLGGLVDSLLGGLGLDKILGSLGLSSAYDALTGKDQKKNK